MNYLNYFIGIGKKKKNRRASKVQMLDYLSTKHADNLKLKEKQLELEEKRLRVEEKKIELEELKWRYMSSAKEDKNQL